MRESAGKCGEVRERAGKCGEVRESAERRKRAAKCGKVRENAGNEGMPPYGKALLRSLRKPPVQAIGSEN